ncbi:MAG: SIMPL domain-containing protein [Deltaproteobacteria bacterium]|nr:SIMPL domain-containing protein [Deltaproteobacteria bacterium]
MKPVHLAVLALTAVALGAGLSVVACAWGGPPASAAPGTAERAAGDPGPTITVTGVTEITMAPDMASLRVGVVAFEKDRARAVDDTKARAERVLTAIRKLGVPASDVATDVLAIGETTRYVGGVAREGVEARRDVVVTVRKLDVLEPLVTAMLDAGATNVSDIRFSRSDLTALKASARERAVQAARDKARAMAKAIGQDIGPAVALSEVPPSSPTTISPVYSNAVIAAGGASLSGATIESGQVHLTVTIYADFALR